VKWFQEALPEEGDNRVIMMLKDYIGNTVLNMTVFANGALMMPMISNGDPMMPMIANGDPMVVCMDNTPITISSVLIEEGVHNADGKIAKAVGV
jgi:hypothetical protein